MADKFTIHRLLSLKKSTAERIENSIRAKGFIDIRQGRRDNVNGVPISKIEIDIKSRYQKILALISNYEKIKSALLCSNSGIDPNAEIHRIEVAGKRYSMAELISASDEIYGNKKHPNGFKSMFLIALRSSNTDAIQKIETQNQRVEDDIKDYLERSADSDKSMSADEIRKRSEIFHQDRDFSLIDPLDLKDKIDKLSMEITNFREECDAAISEHNALTTVEIDLTNID